MEGRPGPYEEQGTSSAGLAACVSLLVGFMLMALPVFFVDGCTYEIVGNKPFLGSATGQYKICEYEPDEWVVEFEQTGFLGSRWRYLHHASMWGDGAYVTCWPTKQKAMAAAQEHHLEMKRTAFIPQCDTTMVLR